MKTPKLATIATALILAWSAGALADERNRPRGDQHRAPDQVSRNHRPPEHRPPPVAWHDRHAHRPAPAWRGDIARFRDHDAGTWRSGHWNHGHHDGRLGWWWVVGGLRYFYPQRILPYPEPYPASVIVAESPPANYWYYCPSPAGYYPYVPSCAYPWEPVPAY